MKIDQDIRQNPLNFRSFYKIHTKFSFWIEWCFQKKQEKSKIYENSRMSEGTWQSSHMNEFMNDEFVLQLFTFFGKR